MQIWTSAFDAQLASCCICYILVGHHRMGRKWQRCLLHFRWGYCQGVFEKTQFQPCGQSTSGTSSIALFLKPITWYFVPFHYHKIIFLCNGLHCKPNKAVILVLTLTKDSIELFWLKYVWCLYIPHAMSCEGYYVFYPSISQSFSPSVLFFLWAQLLWNLSTEFRETL